MRSLSTVFADNLMGLSLKKYYNVPYRQTYVSRNIQPEKVAIVLVVGTARVKVDYRPVIAKIHRLEFTVLADEAIKFIAANSTGLVADGRCRWRLCLSVVPTLALLWRLLTVRYSLLAIVC